MSTEYNNADYGMTFQKRICIWYDLLINEHASEQFKSNTNDIYEKEIDNIIQPLFDTLKDKPVRLLTYTKDIVDGKECLSPHNFLLKSGKTLSIRTTKSSDKVAPRILGQAGFEVLNEYFRELFGRKIETQADIRELMYEHIHEVLPQFIDKLFQSDYTILINKNQTKDFQIIKSEEVSNLSFERDEFTFTRGLSTWTESTTLKYHGKSIAEIQTHKERSFKFRFIISSIPEWIKLVKENNETLGMSAEVAICDCYSLEKPSHFKTRASLNLVKELMPVIMDAFINIPKPILHSGSLPGQRGEQSKCSYDFLLEGNLTLSLKTNKGKMVCPPEVGQPGAKTCLLYFSHLVDEKITEMTPAVFKDMVYGNIEKMLPIYVEHLFDSDWLLWIYKEKDEYKHIEISKDDIKEFRWEKDKISFTKKIVDEWNESNTVKYDGMTIGEFQIHKNRSCYKFRFQLLNLLKILRI